MRIAIIGWGSLIWDPRQLALHGRWHKDGPMLPLEFARISSGDRVTLVTYQGADPSQTYWAASAFDDTTKARANLREREGTSLSSIGLVNRNATTTGLDPVSATIARWLRRRNDLDAAVWTALETNWIEKRKVEFSIDDAIQHLRELKEKGDEIFALAAEYVRNAPEQTKTALRSRLATDDDFRPATLSPELFE